MSTPLIPVAPGGRDVGVSLDRAAARPGVARGAESETVDVGELAAAIARGWRSILVGVALGLLGALALVMLYPPIYRATSTVLVRNGNDPTSSLMSRFGGGAGAEALGGAALGGVLKSPLETELQLLGSRDVFGRVVDSLGLQARVLAPHGVPSRVLLQPAVYAGGFKRITYDFRRVSGGAYEARGNDSVITLRPGQPATLPVVGRVTLGDSQQLPMEFRVQFEDREDAITRVDEHMSIAKRGGEVVDVVYSGPDSLTAAAVPNAVAAVYLHNRRTVDRGLNQRRYEFLAAQSDSVGRQLGSAEDALRREQEGTGVFDPELAGKSGADALRLIDEQLGTAEAERQSIHRVLDDAERGVITPRQLAAFPTFLKSPAINSIITQIAETESDRTELRERRTDRDPEVGALTQSINDLEHQLIPLGRTYAASLDQQVLELQRQRDAVQQRLGALPRQAQGNLERQRDVKLLTQTSIGLQSQLLDTRLAAISEGGQVRQVDAAMVPKRIYFPRPLPTYAVGLVLGALAGMVWAVIGGALTSRVATPGDAERATGLPAVATGRARPLLLGATVDGTVLLLPVGTRAPVAGVIAQLAAAARRRGRRVAIVGADAADAVVSAATRDHDLVLVETRGLADPGTAAVLDPARAVLLVAAASRVRRRDLADVVTEVERLGVTCLGVVLGEPQTATVAARSGADDVAAATPAGAIGAGREAAARV
ncbi:MAG TPA: Wzz/FepE/Etk N-terminal domain-containing protein [Gemmatirosa sp.]